MAVYGLDEGHRIRNALDAAWAGNHLYIELRKQGKRLVYYCTTCLLPLIDETKLGDHLAGKKHERRLAFLEANQWLSFRDDITCFAPDFRTLHCRSDRAFNLGEQQQMWIPDVYIGHGESREFNLWKVGMARIGYHFYENEELVNIRRIWCEWLGNDGQENVLEEQHWLAIVVFFYDDKELGTYHSDSSDEEEDEIEAPPLIQPLFPLMKPVEKELVHGFPEATLALVRRGQKERNCDICLQKLQKYRDVAALYHRGRGQLVCRVQKRHPHPHQEDVCMFHVSCLIHWMLLGTKDEWAMQVEMQSKATEQEKPKKSKGRRRGKHPQPNPILKFSRFSLFLMLKRKGKKRKAARRMNGEYTAETKDELDDDKLVYTPFFVPQCFAGIADDLPEVVKAKLEMLAARKRWVNYPEFGLVNPSMGLSFPYERRNNGEDFVAYGSHITFYRAFAFL